MSSFESTPVESTPVESTSIVKCELCETIITLENISPCDICKVIGCFECVKTECCDCCIQLCRKCSDIDDLMCDCFGKCNTCGTDVSRGSGWPCDKCGIWNCPECKKSVKNLCNECGPSPESEKVKTTFNCESCKTEYLLEKAIRCKLCNINDKDADDAGLDEDNISVDSWDGKIKHLFCKDCTRKCHACEERGCKECVEFACCDCGYNMCYECRNNEVDCGCYGNCYSCGTDVNRGSEGWPCGECEKWYCWGCRQCDNSCKECGPESDSDSESESVANLEEANLEEANLEEANLEEATLRRSKLRRSNKLCRKLRSRKLSKRKARIIYILL
jgi:hypothetical protein